MARFEVIVIGCSAGGLSALKQVFGSLPQNFPLPIVIVQHLAANRDNHLPELLQHACKLAVVEVQDKDRLQPGTVYVAPPNYHVLVDRGTLSLGTDAPVNFSRPSIDVLFESAAQSYGEQAIGVALTSAGDDGAKGMARIKRAGGYVLVQDPSTAEYPVLPMATLKATPVDRIAPLQELGLVLMELAAK